MDNYSDSQIWHSLGSSGGIVQPQINGFFHQIADWVGLGWGPRISISDKFPYDVSAAGSGQHLEDHGCIAIVKLFVPLLVYEFIKSRSNSISRI